MVEAIEVENVMNPLLLELQSFDSLAVALKREKGKLDDGTQTRAERDTLSASLGEVEAQIAVLGKQSGGREDELKAAETKIARQQDRLMNAKNAHEVDSLQRDIVALGKARGDLDEAILMLMDESETASNQARELQSQRDETAARATEIEAHFRAETTRLDAEIAQTQKQREQIAAQLDAPSRAKYDEFARRFGGVAVTHSNGGNCSACGMTLTAFALREAKTETWPTCESCGRLLFVPQS